MWCSTSRAYVSKSFSSSPHRERGIGEAGGARKRRCFGEFSSWLHFKLSSRGFSPLWGGWYSLWGLTLQPQRGRGSTRTKKRGRCWNRNAASHRGCISSFLAPWSKRVVFRSTEVELQITPVVNLDI